MSLQSFFTSIKNDVTGFFAGLPAAEQAFIKELEPIFTGAAGTFVSAMMPVAEGIVLGLATTGQTSNAKRDAAVAQVESAATTAGLTILSGAANLVVEAAFSKLSATGALAAAAAPASAAPAAPAAASATEPAPVG